MKHHRLTPYAYLLVPLLLVGFAQLFPSAYTIYLGFTEWDIISAPQFIGLENYAEIFSNRDLRTALLNTFFWVIGTLLAPVGFALIIAKVLTFVKRGRLIYKSIFFIPSTLAPTIAAIIWRRVLTTEKGAMFSLFPGVEATSVLTNPDINTLIMIGVWTWQFLGLNLILFLVGFESIPRAPVEAAQIDGANDWQIFRRVELPLLRPIALLVVGNAIINSSRMFDIPWVMTSGGPGRASETLAISLYRESFLLFHLGLGAAIGVVISVLTLIASFRYFSRAAA